MSVNSLLKWSAWNKRGVLLYQPADTFYIEMFLSGYTGIISADYRVKSSEPEGTEERNRIRKESQKDATQKQLTEVNPVLP